MGRRAWGRVSRGGHLEVAHRPDGRLLSLLLQDELLQEGQHINRLEMLFHRLNDFGDGHPIVDFAGKPRVILGVPQISVQRIVSHKLHSLNIGYQYIYPFLGHFVFGSYPGHGLGFRGLGRVVSKICELLEIKNYRFTSSRLGYCPVTKIPVGYSSSRPS